LQHAENETQSLPASQSASLPQFELELQRERERKELRAHYNNKNNCSCDVDVGSAARTSFFKCKVLTPLNPRHAPLPTSYSTSKGNCSGSAASVGRGCDSGSGVLCTLFCNPLSILQTLKAASRMYSSSLPTLHGE